MTDKRKSAGQTNSRDDRLRAALRANLARRKAQARARSAQEEQVETTTARPADTKTARKAGAETGETEGNE